MSDAINENGHEFVTGAEVGFGPNSSLWSIYVCKQCGIVRREDGKNNSCRGRIPVVIRNNERVT